MSLNKVTVYAPDGSAEKHTRPNARDLVNGAGYSWNPKTPSNPVAIAPFAVPLNKKFEKSKAQEVFDSIGGNPDRPTDGAPAADADGDADEASEEVLETVEVASDANAASVEEAAPEPRTRRSRTK